MWRVKEGRKLPESVFQVQGQSQQRQSPGGPMASRPGDCRYREASEESFALRHCLKDVGSILLVLWGKQKPHFSSWLRCLVDSPILMYDGRKDVLLLTELSTLQKGKEINRSRIPKEKTQEKKKKKKLREVKQAMERSNIS